MSEKKKKVKVRILNEEYTLTGDGSEEDLKVIASYVDAQMNDIFERLPMATYKRVAVLAALNIAEELMAVRARGVHDPDILKRTERLIHNLEIELGDDESA